MMAAFAAEHSVTLARLISRLKEEHAAEITILTGKINVHGHRLAHGGSIGVHDNSTPLTGYAERLDVPPTMRDSSPFSFDWSFDESLTAPASSLDEPRSEWVRKKKSESQVSKSLVSQTSHRSQKSSAMELAVRGLPYMHSVSSGRSLSLPYTDSVSRDPSHQKYLIEESARLKAESRAEGMEGDNFRDEFIAEDTGDRTRNNMKIAYVESLEEEH